MAQGIGRASALLASGTLISRVLGFVKSIVIASTIGVVGSASADAFTNANQLPGNIYSLIAGGMLNAVLVPQVVQAARHADGGQRYINRLVTLAIVILGGISLAATLGAPIIARLYGASLGAEQLALVVAFAYWCLPQIFFYGLYAVLGEVLNARGMFGPFAWAPVLNNVVGIAGLLAFAALFGADPTGQRPVAEWTLPMIAMLAGSTTLGIALQALILFAFWRRVGLSYRPDFHWRGTGLGKAGKLAGWSFGMLIIVQLAGLVETNIANIAFGQAASVTAMATAYLIFTLPHGIITVSIATAYFTRMSASASENRIDDLVKDFSGGFRLIGLFIVFSAFGLAVISTAFARIFEESPQKSFALAGVLICFLIGLVPFCGLFLVQRAFYALEDTRTQFWMFLATMPLQIFGMAIASLQPMDRIAASLALTQTIMAALRLGILMWLLRRRLGGLDARRITASYVLYTIAGIVAACGGGAVMWLLGAYADEGFALDGRGQAMIACTIGGTTMIVLYFATLLLLRSRDLLDALGPLLRRFRRGGEEEQELEESEEEEYEEPEAAEEPEEIDWSAGPPTEAMPLPPAPRPRPERPRPEPALGVLRDPTDPIRVPWDDEEVWGAEERNRRDEAAYAGAWAMGGVTEDLSTAGIILPLLARPGAGPRSRRERRELERRAAAQLQAKREREARQRAAGQSTVAGQPTAAAGPGEAPRPRRRPSPGRPAPGYSGPLEPPPGRLRSRPPRPGDPIPDLPPRPTQRRPRNPQSPPPQSPAPSPHPRRERPQGPQGDAQDDWTGRPD
ncbi:MAG: murein biosynthesis integral membrane protein MurJ [Pseudoclavibacter sp.]|nr:murein biosynthesis integral membrane protein MurJ [Pseudoclavibacter sp.]